MKDKYVSKTCLDSKLVEYLLDGISCCKNKLEKAIYLYIKLCRTFSYHNEYYIFDGDKIVACKHETIDNITTYNTINNQVICYEFTAIYAKLLELIGIKFKVKYKKDIDYFGGQHTNLTFKYNDFIIYADSVTSILDGDLFRSKIGLDLVGIMCKNEDQLIKDKFERILESIYLKLNDKSYLHYFSKLKYELNGIELEKKIMYFSKISNMVFTSCMDKLSLMLYLRRSILTDLEKEKCEMLIVKNNSKELKYANLYPNQLAFPTMVIIVNNCPYIFVPGNNLVKITINELRKLFNNNSLEYKIDNPKRLNLIK